MRRWRSTRDSHQIVRDNAHIEMGFAAGPGAGMSGMVCALIRHGKFLRGKGGSSFSRMLSTTAMMRLRRTRHKVKQYVFLFFTASGP
jgi:hypothetical protein